MTDILDSPMLMAMLQFDLHVQEDAVEGKPRQGCALAPEDDAKHAVGEACAADAECESAQCRGGSCCDVARLHAGCADCNPSLQCTNERSTEKLPERQSVNGHEAQLAR